MNADHFVANYLKSITVLRFVCCFWPDVRLSVSASRCTVCHLQWPRSLLNNYTQSVYNSKNWKNKMVCKGCIFFVWGSNKCNSVSGRRI